MRKVFLVIASVFSLGVANAQTGKNQIGIGVDLGLPMGDFGDVAKLGIGGTAKYLHGVGSAGQVTLTSGYISFAGKDFSMDIDGDGEADFEAEGGSQGLIPIMAGYRHNFSGAYLEPQIGYLKATGEGASGAFSWAIGGGYALQQGLDLGVRYQSASKDGFTTSFIGFRVGYNFSLGGGSASK